MNRLIMKRRKSVYKKMWIKAKRASSVQNPSSPPLSPIPFDITDSEIEDEPSVSNVCNNDYDDHLLNILRDVKSLKDLHELPKTAQTLLKTERSFVAEIKSGMEFLKWSFKSVNSIECMQRC